MTVPNRLFGSALRATAAYALLTVLTTHPLWLALATAVPGDIGDPLLNTWILAWDVHALLRDPLHLFDANIFFPLKNTLAYSEHLLGTALTVTPLLLVSGEPVLAYNAAFLASFLLSGLGLYLLVVRHTGDRTTAFLAGLAFAFGPYRLAAMSHLQLLTVQWLPFALLFLDDFLCQRRARSLALCTFFFAWQAISSWHLAVFSSFSLLIYGGGWWLVRRKALSWPILGQLGLAALAVTLIVLPLGLPYLAALDELRAARPPVVAAFFATNPSDYLAAAPFNRLFGRITAPLATRPYFNEENYLFLGFLTPLLAICSLAVLRRPASPGRGRSETFPYTFACRRVVFLWITLLGALALTFGPTLRLEIGGREVMVPLPYELLGRLLPVSILIRVPPRWIVAALLALSVLAGHGLAHLSVVWRVRFRPWLRLLPPLLGLGLLAEGFSAPIPLAQVGSMADLPPCYRWLAQDKDDFALLEIPFYSLPGPEYPEAKRLYASTLHWKGLVNGYSGMSPTRQRALGQELDDFPGERSLAAILELGRQGLRYVVVHSLEEGFDREAWEGDGRWRLARSLTLRPVYVSRGDYVYEVNPYGPALITAPQTVTDPRWRARLPHPVEANFSAPISLLAYEVGEGEEGSPSLILYWQALGPMEEDYTVFVHLLNAEGVIVAQGDRPPVEGHYPTSLWRPGELVRDEHHLASGPRNIGVSFAVGLYLPETMKRLPVVNAVGRQIADHIVLPR